MMDDAITASGLYEKYNIERDEDLIHIICELDQRIKELEAENEKLRHAIDGAVKYGVYQDDNKWWLKLCELASDDVKGGE